MSENKTPVGTILWHDLTVDNAERIRDFYSDVVGWKVESVDMGGYTDFNMIAPGSGEPTAGVCHARESNAGFPPQWMTYFVVENVEESARKCREQGGEVLIDPRPLAGTPFCVIRDPAGAVCALCESAG